VSAPDFVVIGFGEESVEGGGDVRTRADQVRTAFNSPFWPFVLASTSVGQGLDFHLYCHAVVHWNLPSNPVDLEQREGRVHRFNARSSSIAWSSARPGKRICSATCKSRLPADRLAALLVELGIDLSPPEVRDVAR